MAEGLFNVRAAKGLPDVRALSCGLSALEGQPAAENAVLAAARYGADLSGHSARRISRSLVAGAKRVLAMTEGHVYAISQCFPDLAYLVERLDDIDITDPFGGGEAVYTAAAEQINDCVLRLVDRLSGQKPLETNPSVLPLEERHIDQAAAIEKVCFSLPWSPAMLREEIRDSEAFYLCAEWNGVLAGYAGMRVVLDEGHITNIATAPDFRRRGIASLLLDGLLSKGTERLLSFLTLDTRVSNRAAIALYEKHGFMHIGVRPGYYEKPEEDALIMTAYLSEGGGMRQ